jgi:hypothetical protein
MSLKHVRNTQYIWYNKYKTQEKILYLHTASYTYN